MDMRIQIATPQLLSFALRLYGCALKLWVPYSERQQLYELSVIRVWSLSGSGRNFVRRLGIYILQNIDQSNLAAG